MLPRSLPIWDGHSEFLGMAHRDKGNTGFQYTLAPWRPVNPPIHPAKEYFLCTSAGISSSHMEGPELLQSQAERSCSNLLNAGQKEHVASLRELLGFSFILETEEHPASSVLGTPDLACPAGSIVCSTPCQFFLAPRWFQDWDITNQLQSSPGLSIVKSHWHLMWLSDWVFACIFMPCLGLQIKVISSSKDQTKQTWAANLVTLANL